MMLGRCACVFVTMGCWPSPPTVTSSAWPRPSSSKKMSCMNASRSSRGPSCPFKRLDVNHCTSHCFTLTFKLNTFFSLFSSHFNHREVFIVSFLKIKNAENMKLFQSFKNQMVYLYGIFSFQYINTK